jgi:hypothetical protein
MIRENRSPDLADRVKKKIYFLFIARTIPAIPIAPITTRGTIPARVVAVTAEGVQAVVGSGCTGVSASSGRVVVAVRIFVWAELTGGSTLTI